MARLQQQAVWKCCKIQTLPQRILQNAMPDPHKILLEQELHKACCGETRPELSKHFGRTHYQHI